MVSVREKFTERLNQAQKASGVSKSSIGAAVGKDRQTVYRWFSGANMPSLEEIEIISELTGYPVYWFYGGELPENKTERMRTEAAALLAKLENESNIEQVLKTLEILHGSEKKSNQSKAR